MKGAVEKVAVFFNVPCRLGGCGWRSWRGRLKASGDTTCVFQPARWTRVLGLRHIFSIAPQSSSPPVFLPPHYFPEHYGTLNDHISHLETCLICRDEFSTPLGRAQEEDALAGSRKVYRPIVWRKARKPLLASSRSSTGSLLPSGTHNQATS